MPKLSPLSDHADLNPDALAIIDNDKHLSYSKLERLVEKGTAYLISKRINKNSRFVFIARNRSEEIVLLWALYHLKAVAIPLSFRYTAEQLKKILDILKPESLIAINDDTFDSDIPTIDFSFDRVEKEHPSELKPFDLSAEVGIILSSGTTCDPKAVVHTLGNYYYSALGANTLLDLVAGDRYLVSLPLYHVGGIGIMFRTLLAGATLIIPDKDLTLPENIDKYKITHLSLVATQLKELVETIDESIALKLKAVLLGGSFIPDKLIDDAINKNIPIIKSYGSTESSSLVTATKIGDDIEKLKTSGKVLPHREIKISDEGEIILGGEVLFKGYLNAQLKKTVDGCFHSGDFGFIDENGYLSVTGRKDNMFISGGENIHPEEIEIVLLNVDGIDEAIVVPIDDANYGMVPIAFVKCSKEISCDNIEWPFEKFKIPQKIYPIPNDYKKTGLKINRQYFIELAKELSS